MIDLTAILEQHRRGEVSAKRKLHPAIRVTGFDEADKEAAALCDAIDEAAARTMTAPEMISCTRVSSFARRLDW